MYGPYCFQFVFVMFIESGFHDKQTLINELATKLELSI